MPAFSNSNATFTLLVERGQTRFRERPIDTDRFLVGAGSNCHLQLGGQMPILHSIIIPEGDHLWIDAVVAAPALVVNGQIVREAELKSGDIIEVGEFVFCLSRSEHVTLVAVEDLPTPTALSAQELVEAIEAELKTLQAVDVSREQGAISLLQAAGFAPGVSNGESKNADSVIPTLVRLIDELRIRATTLDQREASLQAHAQQLEQTQHTLQAQLLQACEKLHQPGEEESSGLRLTA